MAGEPILLSHHAAPRGAYNPALVVPIAGGRLLFASGQLAWGADGKVVAPHDAAAQSEFVFGLIGDLLGAAGMSFGDVVRVQTYLTDMADFPKFRAVRDRFLADVKPASTLIEVKGLAHPGCCVEVEITAVQLQQP